MRFFISLFILEVALFLTNYKNDTYLVGWDNLFPELNFPVNFTRSFFAIWQEYRGLGLLDGMSYAANLPHYLFLYLLSFFLPENILRYLFLFLMHFLGGLGVYFLSRLLLPESKSRNFACFAGSLFYLLSLATVQIFFAPYELFAVHFAFLPWLSWSAIGFLKTGERKSAIWFILFSFAAIPQAHVPTIFVVYLLVISAILLTFIIRKALGSLRRAGLILSLVFIINSFWILPYLYSLKENPGIIMAAKINQMSSEEVFLKNKLRGTLADVALLKGFMLDVIEHDQQGETGYIMEKWREHLDAPAFIIPSLLFLAVALIGLGTVIARREVNYYPFIFISLISVLFLASDVPGIDLVNNVIRNGIPILGEALRFSFTKFIIILTLSYGLFIARGIGVLLEVLTSLSSNTFKILIIFLFLFYSLPAYQGEFFSNTIKLKIPSEYFDAINFFNGEDRNTRIAPFPQQTFWSWRFYEWGSRGSGFFWYGIPQSTLDRAFDPWSNYNENYYWELSYAVYSGNATLLERVLEKYQINWLLVDENVINLPSPKALYFDELEDLLNGSSKVKLAQTFGKIKIYNVSLDAPVRNFVYLAENLPTVGPVYKWNNNDVAYAKNLDYVSASSDERLASSYSPFRSLFTGRNPKEREFEVEDRGNYFAFTKKLSGDFTDYYLEIPEIKDEDLAYVNPDDLSQIKIMLADIFFDGKIVEVKVPKVSGLFSAELDAKNEREFFLKELPHKLSYLIAVQNQNLEGRPPLFWLENLNSRRADLETYLPQTNNSQLITSYFIQPPMEHDGIGYTLHFDEIQFGSEKYFNYLGKITVNPIPYDFLKSLVLKKPDTNLPSTKLIKVDAKHPNPTFYSLTMEQFSNSTINNSVLVLSQSYEKGWKAYRIRNYESGIMNFFASAFPFIFGEEIKDHTLVNNWENGWVLNNLTMQQSNNSTIVIIYLPQYLEFAGFILLLTIPLIWFKILRGM